ncbi:hypothetical protein [Paracidovorax cattleyae]|uniref:Uncharacterized protein n=1 Tax=Paracidovorax cattleyae TaxID=80868 RepID=A0A1H0W758_9BURK|nr:hypothetical protein [Paracidovorax cattleyae]SDP86579.1 hypothetical protein SAMN04489708_13354 [Paracidovorax cattleyae]
MRFPEFRQALLDQYGEEAADTRHEAYFLARRGGMAVLRALLAALRDAWLCWRLPAEPEPESLGGWVALATLPGSNGWAALAPCVADLAQRGIACSVLMHPRLRGRVAGREPARPSAQAWRHALGAWRLRALQDGVPAVSPWLVRSCVFRQRLWRGAWERTLAAHPGGTLLLHNDFDLYAVALLRAAGTGWRSVCVQHGLPTDEFFPARAQRHVLWGPSSAEVYARHGVAAHALGYGPVRAIHRAPGAPVPAALYLVSQTHTPIYGRPLAAEFLALARKLAQDRPGGLTLQILLHPEEVRGGHPYAGTELAPLCRQPPHAPLAAGGPPAVVAGFCSTALLEAAACGHYVVGMDWPAAASAGAQAVGRPARQVADAPALSALVRQLCGDAGERAAFLAQQSCWLQRSFDADPEWPHRPGRAP